MKTIKRGKNWRVQFTGWDDPEREILVGVEDSLTGRHCAAEMSAVEARTIANALIKAARNVEGHPVESGGGDWVCPLCDTLHDAETDKPL